jgi:H+/Cl- antiporter ClcA
MIEDISRAVIGFIVIVAIVFLLRIIGLLFKWLGKWLGEWVDKGKKERYSSDSAKKNPLLDSAKKNCPSVA